MISYNLRWNLIGIHRLRCQVSNRYTYCFSFCRNHDEKYCFYLNISANNISCTVSLWSSWWLQHAFNKKETFCIHLFYTAGLIYNLLIQFELNMQSYFCFVIWITLNCNLQLLPLGAAIAYNEGGRSFKPRPDQIK